MLGQEYTIEATKQHLKDTGNQADFMSFPKEICLSSPHISYCPAGYLNQITIPKLSQAMNLAQFDMLLSVMERDSKGFHSNPGSAHMVKEPFKPSHAPYCAVHFMLMLAASC